MPSVTVLHLVCICVQRNKKHNFPQFLSAHSAKAELD